MAEAAKAYEADRYADVRRLLKPLVAAGNPSPEVRELYGLTLYRMGRWADAIAELKAFASTTGSYDQHPVLADCHRALKRWRAVDDLWEELRQASPGPEVVGEGRIVAAGAMADRGDISGALKLLERAPSNVKRPALHHLRLWYARADLYERAGEIPRARELFRTILGHEPGFVDTAERLAALD
ncbi:MAG TPA: tetratricopeptide repeat protein [Acidimicrobiales bacterium]|nr:tetratricopeptide repeat protein [Acidimicrobiales bacterium]